MLTTSYDLWLSIKAKMLDGLYTTQIKYWNAQLTRLIQKNAHHLGIALSEVEATNAAVQYKNKTWRALPLNWLTDSTTPPEYHFPVFEDDPELKAQFDKVTTEMAKITRERYETDRFMSCLNMFGLSGNQLHQTLGDNLYNIIAKSADNLFCETGEIYQAVTFERFLQQNTKILTHMQERVLVNLLMSDITR